MYPGCGQEVLQRPVAAGALWPGPRAEVIRLPGSGHLIMWAWCCDRSRGRRCSGPFIERDWPLQVDRVTLVRPLANDGYRVDPGHFLKVYRHGWRTGGGVAWEADLIAHLACSGIPVAAVTPRRD